MTDKISVLQKHRAKLMNARGPVISKDETDGTYGVSTEGDDCVISLGPIPPFRIPQSTAIKLAMLILRRCGVEVERG